jgi:hypothetical protein
MPEGDSRLRNVEAIGLCLDHLERSLRIVKNALIIRQPLLLLRKCKMASICCSLPVMCLTSSCHVLGYRRGSLRAAYGSIYVSRTTNQLAYEYDYGYLQEKPSKLQSPERENSSGPYRSRIRIRTAGETGQLTWLGRILRPDQNAHSPMTNAKQSTMVHILAEVPQFALAAFGLTP